jgi:putative glycosyltransferase (TIGR04372 family)
MHPIINIYNQINKTILHIRKGGWSVLIYTLIKVPYRLALIIVDFLALPISIPIIILIRIIKPIYHIRFGYFYGGRIGHFVFDTAMAAIIKRNNSEGAYLFYFLPNISNLHWAKMVKRELNVFYWVRLLDFANSFIPGGEDHSIIPGLNQAYTSRDINGLIYHSDFSFTFTNNETESVKKWLHTKGWKEGEKIVCFHVRDNEYLPTKNWSYHDFRNSDVKTFIPAMELLANKGYWVIRMGKTMKEPIKTSHTKIIDFAFDKNRNDLIDIWLCANCELMISTGSGPDAISDVYRRPILHLNYLPSTELHSWSNATCYPKKLYWKDSGLLLSFEEYCQNSFFYSERYEYFGINIVDLSPEEITNSVLEKIEIIEGKYIQSMEHEQLQNNFWDTALKNKKFSDINKFIHPNAGMSISFLKSNPNWLN